MRSRVSFSRTLWIAVTFTVVASAAHPAPGAAWVPSPRNMIIPPFICLVGSSGGVTDPAGNFTVIIRDNNNIPINNSLVVVDFSGCSGVTVCQAQPGLVVDCPTQTVRGFTNAVGMITMAIAGHGNDALGNQPPFNAPKCARIYADGILIGGVSVSIYDHEGNGLSGADFGAVLADFFGSQPLRSDYDGSGAVTGADISQWLAVFFGSRSVSNCPSTGAQCPAIP